MLYPHIWQDQLKDSHSGARKVLVYKEFDGVIEKDIDVLLWFYDWLHAWIDENLLIKPDELWLKMLPHHQVSFNKWSLHFFRLDNPN